jgi:Sulfotransferase family
VIISFDRKFVFVHIAKTAGDSVTKGLVPHLGKHSVVVSNDFQALRDGLLRPRYRSLYKLAKHSTATEIREALSPETWSNFYKFAFVRDPIDRAKSLYTFIERKAEERARLLPRNIWYATLPNKDDDPLNWPAVIAYRETDSFSQFIHHPSALSDQAMYPQSTFLYDADGTSLVDFVGRVEHIDDDMGQIARRIGLEDVPLQNTNKSKRTLSRDDITSADRDYLHQLFSVDYERFGYE